MDHLESYGVDVGKGKYHEEVVYRLIILSNRILDKISVYLGQHQLTSAKMNVLMIVKHQGVDYFKTMAEEMGVPYQQSINMYLRDCAQSRRRPDWVAY